MDEGTAAERLQGQAEWMGRLLAAFGGTPAGWEWTGEVREQDPSAFGGVRCACGQQGLRYLFPWRKTGVTGEIITGSVCVNNVPGLSAEQLQRVQAEVERREVVEQEAKAAIRKADKAAQVNEVAREIRAMLDRVLVLDARYHRREPMEPEQWMLAQQYEGYSYNVRQALRLKTESGKLGRLSPMRDRLAKKLAASDAIDAARSQISAAGA